MLNEALFVLVSISTTIDKTQPNWVTPMENFQTQEDCESRLISLAKESNLSPGYELVTNLGQLFAVSKNKSGALSWYGCLEIKESYWN